MRPDRLRELWTAGKPVVAGWPAECARFVQACRYLTAGSKDVVEVRAWTERRGAF